MKKRCDIKKNTILQQNWFILVFLFFLQKPQSLKSCKFLSNFRCVFPFFFVLFLKNGPNPGTSMKSDNIAGWESNE